MLALLDALALAVMHVRRFSREDYALFHPAGSLGRRLILRVCDLMRKDEQMAVAGLESTVWEALWTITRAQAGSVLAVDGDGRFVGILSDGDIRRLQLRDREALERTLQETVNRSPRTVGPDLLVSEALAIMEQNPPCGELPVLDEDGRPLGVLNLKDVVRAGIQTG
jgi:arabinose-5-phosphate isomerase